MRPEQSGRRGWASVPASPVTPAVTPAATPRAPWRPLHVRLVLGVFWLYPLLWVLGVQSFSWTVAVALLVPGLLTARNDLRVPGGFGLWLLFLGWVLASATMLSGADRISAAVFRAACYVTGTVILLFLVNVDETLLSNRRLALAAVALWGWSVGLGVVALFVPDLSFTSAFEAVLPESVQSIQFIHDLVHPTFGARDALVDVPRPRPLYPYTNSWAAAVGLLTPIVIYARGQLLTHRARRLLDLALVGSLVPIIISVNRGLWLTVAVAGAWVVGRRFLRGDVRYLFLAAAGVAVGAVVVVTTPLLGIIQARFANPNTITRQILYEASLKAAGQSPLIGWGSPVSSAGLHDSNSVSVGTHGQFWTVLVSQGWPGIVLFTGFLVAMVVLTWRVPDRALWLHGALAATVVQILFYDLLPVGICIYAVALALTIRECRTEARTEFRTESRTAAAEPPAPHVVPAPLPRTREAVR